ncbi:hypothetical protein [Ensifer sp.]|jgi:hypothetical protein|uniref:hypothetical protein n=1 Tax=Ensifer sp. TaxID=1872086 RepID=UPI002E128DE1
MDDSNTKSLVDWGKELLKEYPDGLGARPDFEHSAAARSVWFAQGYTVGVTWAKEIGIGGKVFLEKVYDDPNALDNAGKAEFAAKAFDLARLYVTMAKLESDKQAGQEAVQRAAVAAVDKDVEALRGEIAAVSSREDLRIRLDKIKAASRGARSAGNAIEDYGLSRKIEVLQGRLIEIETKESQLAFNGFVVTVIGTVAGIIGLAAGYLAGSGTAPSPCTPAQVQTMTATDVERCLQQNGQELQKLLEEKQKGSG